jgi:Uma2 family endonuclease
MATATSPAVQFEHLAELVESLGGIPLDRILIRPPLGTATEEDVVAALERGNKRLCELVDGVLVEKVMSTREARYALFIGRRIDAFAQEQDLGLTLGADGAVRLMPGLVRIPDVSFISWDRLPGEELPDEPVADLAPDLAVEVLSKRNTPKEMSRKLREYFEAGVRLVWLIYPKTQTAEAYTSPTEVRRIGKKQALSGDDVLPGFTLALSDIFASTRRPKRGR